MMKILVTIGPVSSDPVSIQKFAKKTKLFRLNGSHGSIEWHKNVVDTIRKACPDAFILMDIPGVKPRTNNKEEILISKGQEVIFGDYPADETLVKIELTKPLPKNDKPPTNFSVNDGQYLFDFVSSGEGYITGRSQSKFTLLPKKGINLPGSLYDERHQLEIYRDFIENVVDMNIDALGLSFVQTGELVNEVRKIAPHLLLISKVENSEGLRNCVDIIQHSDSIMIDRGDLAAEIGLSELYDAVETISTNTKAHGKPLIMATENLESMIDREVPSKSEVMSIAHSASNGVDCIMLSEETATAINCQDTVNWLEQFLQKPFELRHTSYVPLENKKFPIIWKSLNHFRPLPVLLMTKSGYALFNFFAVRPEEDLFVVTDNPKIKNVSKLFSNQVTIISTEIANNMPIEVIWKVIEQNKKLLFANSDQLLGIYVSKYVRTARANSITIFDKADFDL